MKILEKILVLILLVMLVLPAIQKEYPLIKVRELDGDFVLAEKTKLSWDEWKKGTFQAQFDKYLEDHIGFRDFLVRFTNQLDYSLFRKIHAEGVVIGKNDQLYEYDYIRAYMGGDFIGKNVIDKKIRRLKFLQEYLKKEKNIDLILVFEPGKASFYPEYIPNHFYTNKKELTNLKYFVKKAKEHKVRFIDFNPYFKILKGKAEYPLYPKYGIHWSIYGMSYAADSLLKYIENLRQIDMPDVYIDSLQIEKHARRPDYDGGKTLNLLWRLPEKEPLAYPVYRFEENPEKDRPMVLAIADSYYWNIFNTRIPKHLFKNEAFWYFYSMVYPDTYYNPKYVHDLNLKEEIEKQDVILLMVTERFLYKFDWSFIDEAYALYAPVSKYDLLYNYITNILNYSVWFDNVIGKAKAEGKPLDERITSEAEYIFKNKHPDIYNKHLALENNKQKILNDSLLFNHTKALAEKYYMTFDEMLQIEAERMEKSENTKMDDD